MSTPHWEMSQVEIRELNRYDWIYNRPPPKLPKRSKSSFAKNPEPPKEDPWEEIDKLGYKEDIFRRMPARPPLSGPRPPPERRGEAFFNDYESPPMMNKAFAGSRVLGVPLSQHQSQFQNPQSKYRRKVRSRARTDFSNANSKKNRRTDGKPIFDALFEEGCTKDDSDNGIPENIKAPDKIVRGLKLTVSRLKET